MSVNQIVASKTFQISALVVGVFLLVLVSFAAGLRVGMHKALFSARFGENYERNFLGRDDGRDGRFVPRFSGMGMMDASYRGMRNPHGVGGEILSISGDTIVIKGRDDQESTLRVNDETIINRAKTAIGVGDLAVGDRIIVVGQPGDDGIVAARLIRVFSR